MRLTLSAIKADIGSIGGHICPSAEVLQCVRDIVSTEGRDVLRDWYISHTGDDVAILMIHTRGEGDEAIHSLAWQAFHAGTDVARRQGLYGAGQDLLNDAFSGNVRGLGPAVAEMEIEERGKEPFLFFAADKTDPGAYNLPFYLAFADPMYCPGLLLSPNMSKGFRFVIMDVEHTEGDRIIELNAPEDLYDIAVLLRDNQRFVIEAIYSRATGEQAAVVSTSRLHNIAGTYTGKDDPVALVRTQLNFPATGEVLSPFSIGHYVAGCMRGSHTAPLMPVILNSPTSFFDGPPMVSCAAFCVHDGKLTQPADVFSHPFWDRIRAKATRKTLDIREQGFSGVAMLPMSELEYTGVMETLGNLEKQFRLRAEECVPALAS